MWESCTADKYLYSALLGIAIGFLRICLNKMNRWQICHRVEIINIKWTILEEITGTICKYFSAESIGSAKIVRQNEREIKRYDNKRGFILKKYQAIAERKLESRVVDPDPKGSEPSRRSRIRCRKDPNANFTL